MASMTTVTNFGNDLVDDLNKLKGVPTSAPAPTDLPSLINAVNELRYLHNAVAAAPSLKTTK